MEKVIDVDIIEDDRDMSEKKDFIPPEVLYEELITKVKKYHPDVYKRQVYGQRYAGRNVRLMGKIKKTAFKLETGMI